MTVKAALRSLPTYCGSPKPSSVLLLIPKRHVVSHVSWGHLLLLTAVGSQLDCLLAHTDPPELSPFLVGLKLCLSLHPLLPETPIQDIRVRGTPD